MRVASFHEYSGQGPASQGRGLAVDLPVVFPFGFHIVFTAFAENYTDSIYLFLNFIAEIKGQSVFVSKTKIGAV